MFGSETDQSLAGFRLSEVRESGTLEIYLPFFNTCTFSGGGHGRFDPQRQFAPWFNRAGQISARAETETETEDFAQFRPGVGAEAPLSKFAVLAVVAPEPVGRASKPLDVSARALKL